MIWLAVETRGLSLLLVADQLAVLSAPDYCGQSCLVHSGPFTPVMHGLPLLHGGKRRSARRSLMVWEFKNYHAICGMVLRAFQNITRTVNARKPRLAQVIAQRPATTLPAALIGRGTARLLCRPRSQRTATRVCLFRG